MFRSHPNSIFVKNVVVFWLQIHIFTENRHSWLFFYKNEGFEHSTTKSPPPQGPTPGSGEPPEGRTQEGAPKSPNLRSVRSTAKGRIQGRKMRAQMLKTDACLQRSPRPGPTPGSGEPPEGRTKEGAPKLRSDPMHRQRVHPRKKDAHPDAKDRRCGRCEERQKGASRDACLRTKQGMYSTAAAYHQKL